MDKLITLQQFLDKLPQKIKGSDSNLMTQTNCTVLAETIWDTIIEIYGDKDIYHDYEFRANDIAYRMVGVGHNFVVINTSDKGYFLLHSYNGLWSLQTWLAWVEQLHLVKVETLSSLTDYKKFVNDVCLKVQENIDPEKKKYDKQLKQQSIQYYISQALKSIKGTITTKGLYCLK